YYANPDAVPRPDHARIPPPLVVTSTKSAELIKHASNAFLAMKISFINAVANLCEAVSADVSQVCKGIGLDSRIGPKFLRPGIGSVQSLLEEHAEVTAFDPAAMERACEVLPPEVKYASDPYEATQEADALLVLTDWDEFCGLDLERIRQSLRQPILIDGRNMFDPEKVAAAGLHYISVGRPIAQPL